MVSPDYPNVRWNSSSFQEKQSLSIYSPPIQPLFACLGLIPSVGPVPGTQVPRGMTFSLKRLSDTKHCVRINNPQSLYMGLWLVGRCTEL